MSNLSIRSATSTDFFAIKCFFFPFVSLQLPCGSLKRIPTYSHIVQITFYFPSFKIHRGILGTQKTNSLDTCFTVCIAFPTSIYICAGLKIKSLVEKKHYIAAYFPWRSQPLKGHQRGIIIRNYTVSFTTF